MKIRIHLLITGALAVFFRILRFNLKKNWEEVKEMSYKDMDDIGTHSICKGLITCLSSGKTAAPSAVAINIRGGGAWAFKRHICYGRKQVIIILVQWLLI